ncbi:MAG: hypothetical protein LBK99_03020 [Opitutaceae bacterium]|jgi:hypothetical protein|nr:hypothetical protein [Opitutaceae bacterium]
MPRQPRLERLAVTSRRDTLAVLRQRVKLAWLAFWAGVVAAADTLGNVLRALVRLAYPLAVAGGAIWLFHDFGPGGWLWLVLLLALILGLIGPRTHWGK